MEKAKDSDKKKLSEIYSKRTVTSRDAEVVLQIMNSVEAYNYTVSMIDEYYDEAVKNLESVEIAPAIKNELGEVASFVLKDSINN